MEAENSRIYISHYRKTDGRVQTVAEHCRETGRMCMEFLEPRGLGAFGMLLGLLHDMGKFCDDFQEYLSEQIARARQGEKPAKPRVDHGKDGAAFVMERYRGRGESALRKITAEILAMAICYHHGGLQDFINTQENNQDKMLPLITRTGADFQFLQSRERFFAETASENELDSLFEAACGELALYNEKIAQGEKSSRHFQRHLLIKLLYSALIDADRCNTRDFEAGADSRRPRDINGLWADYIGKVEARQRKFQKLKTDSPGEENIRRLRCEIADSCLKAAGKETGIYTLTVPTGGGKTISSLRFALNHAAKGGKKRVIYIIPYTAIIDQNAKEVRELLNCGDNLLEYHSNILLGGGTEDADTAEERYKLVSENFDVPIIFTTMVQFLESIYAGGTQKIRRFHNFQDAVLIFDEVQSVPVKCISLFNEALNFLKIHGNTTSILCSATQPALGNTGKKLLIDGELIPDVSEKFRAFKRMEIVDRTRDPMTHEQMAALLLELQEEKNSALMVTNVTATAAAVYRLVNSAVPSDVRCFYLSTHLCPAHRHGVIGKIKELLREKKKVICVSTKLIEAGVDISFGQAARLLAGMDAIVQTSGRANRHGEGAISQTHVICPNEENLSFMPEVEAGKHCARILMDQFSRYPERYGGDLLSPRAMSEYFDAFYADSRIMGKMDYPIDGGTATIHELLSGHREPELYRRRLNGSASVDPPLLGHRFRTAAEKFRVIDSGGVEVVVPYGRGGELIEKWRSDLTVSERIRLLRELQQYTVNIYEYKRQELERKGAFEKGRDDGFLVLDKRFYDEDLGIVPDGKRFELQEF